MTVIIWTLCKSSSSRVNKEGKSATQEESSAYQFSVHLPGTFKEWMRGSTVTAYNIIDKGYPWVTSSLLSNPLLPSYNNKEA